MNKILIMIGILSMTAPASAESMRDRLQKSRVEERVGQKSGLNAHHSGAQAAFVNPDITVQLKSVPQATEVARIKDRIFAQSDAINEVRYIGSNVIQIKLQFQLSQEERAAFRRELKTFDMVQSVEFIDYAKN